MLMMFSVAAMAALVPRGVAVVRSSVREPAAILKWGDATLTMKQKISGDAKANANRADQFVPSAVQAARDRGLARGWGAAATLLSTRATTADEVCTPTLVRPAHKTPSHAQELLRIDQKGRLPLHNAVANYNSEAEVQYLLDAYPDGAKATDWVSPPCYPRHHVHAHRACAGTDGTALPRRAEVPRRSRPSATPRVPGQVPATPPCSCEQLHPRG